MARKANSCALCETSNLPSICVSCVNYRANTYYATLKVLRETCDCMYVKLSGKLVVKHKADEQRNWRILENEKLAHLKERLRFMEKQLARGRATVEKRSQELRARFELLDSARFMLEKNRVELLGKFYPNLICTQSLGHMAIATELLHKQSVVVKQVCRLFPQRRVFVEGDKRDGSIGCQYDQICNARLPRGLDPHSVPSEELAASLGYMVHLLNLAVRYLAAPVLHNSGFAGSCSRIWQRDSYWDARPASRSNEYPLFIPRQNSCSTSGDNSWSDRSAGNFGITSMESERKPQVDGPGNSSFSYSSASPHTVEAHRELQKGISLLKKSVACVTAYCYNSLHLDIPAEMSTFEAFAKLLYTLSSAKEVRSILSSRMACSRSPKQVQPLNQSILHEQYLGNSSTSSRIIDESLHIRSPTLGFENMNVTSSAPSFLYTTEPVDAKNVESLVEGWDIIEHPTLPPPSQAEDIEHWTRAMITDATRK
ncbi:unnamed protein product [Victoria cruziana]